MMWSFIKLRHFGAAGWLLGVAAVGTGRAQQIPTSPERYKILWTDFAVVGVAGAVGILPDLLGSRLPASGCGPCDPARLWGIDRAAVGDVRNGPALVSDLLVAGTAAAAGVFTLGARPGNAGREDLVVLSQAMTMTAAATGIAQVLFHRPRPPRYGPNAANYADSFYGRSFPSGHTAVAFASAAAYASMMSRRHEAGHRTGEIAVLFGAATATAVMRVAARKHFPTDVAAGAVLGTTIGWLVPQLHAVR